jgi:hypothetical protein
MVAANVGGIPEIFGSYTDALFAPNIVGAMADAKPRWKMPPPRRPAQNPFAKESFCIFRRRRWSMGYWRAIATRLQIVDRSSPTTPVSFRFVV